MSFLYPLGLSCPSSHDGLTNPHRYHLFEVLLAGLKEVYLGAMFVDENPSALGGLEVQTKGVKEVVERVRRTLDARDVRFFCEAYVPKHFGRSLRGPAKSPSRNHHARVNDGAPWIDLRRIV